MEYQKTIISLLKNTPNQSSKFRTKIMYDARGTYNANSQIKVLLNLCAYSDSHIPLKGTITVTGAEGTGNLAERQTTREKYERNKEVIFKNCAPFTYCISKMTNT